MKDISWINSKMTLFYGREAWRQVSVWRVIWRTNQERVILKGILPFAKMLNDFPDGITLEVQHGKCGDPRVYRDGQTIARFIDCKVRNKWIRNLIPATSDQQEIVGLFLEVNCNIEMVFPDE